MRKNPTEPERRLWMALRDKRLSGYKFRRQAIMGYRIVDFFCPAKGLVIEVDGHTHDSAKDQIRDARLDQMFGFRTLRFSNTEVMREMEGVLATIVNVLTCSQDRWPDNTATTTQPPPLKRRGSLSPHPRPAQ